MRKSILKWFAIDILVFLLINGLLIYFLWDRFFSLENVGYFKLLILGLAVYRTANIISNEAITRPLRAPFVDEIEKDGKFIEEPKKSGFLGAMGELICCPSCTGVWISALFAYLYLLFPSSIFFIAFLLALSAIERILAAVVGKLKTEA